ncbi:MAG: hypothetical protein AB8B91_01815 [Rubripirellula sp.]
MSNKDLNETTEQKGVWNSFWFSETDCQRISFVRMLLCVIAIGYFVSSWSDLEFWYTADGPLAASRVARFVNTADVEDAASWIVSPLFLTSSPLIYRIYLIAGVLVACCVAIGRGGRIASWALWLLFVGWANRAMFASGLTESLLSLGLFASAIAPSKPRSSNPTDWTANFSERLVAVQVTVIGLATLVTMLGGRVWFNGLGSFALAAPVEDRTIDWTNSILINTIVHETLTHFLLLAIPVGLVLSWTERGNRVGQVILVSWCLFVALLGSHWLYAATFATMVLAIRPASSARIESIE